MLSALRGDNVATMMESSFEYDPHPKFKVGSPSLAGPKLTQELKYLYQELTNISLTTARTAYQVNRNGVNG